MTNLVQAVRRGVDSQPSKVVYTFLADGEREADRLTYAELDHRARTIAEMLRQNGAAGQRALLLFPPGLDFISAFLGCLYGGVIAVPAYPVRANRPQPRLRSILHDAEPSIALTTGGMIARLGQLQRHLPEISRLRWLTTDPESPDMQAGEATADGWIAPAIDGDSLAFLQYTSGSTATPKGVMVSHLNLIHNEEAIRRAFGMGRDSVVVSWLPPYHDMGLIGSVLQPLYAGARAILMSPMAFLQKPMRWLRAVSEYRADVSGGPNFAFDLCCERLDPEQLAALDLSGWQVAFNGAEPVRPATLERFAETFAETGFRYQAFYPCYGLAEATLFVSGGATEAAAPVASFVTEALDRHRVETGPTSVGDESSDGASATERRLVSSGRAWPGHEIAIVDPETLELAAPDAVGEIWVTGPSIAQGYWRRQEQTARDFHGSIAGEAAGTVYLRTGDLGFLDCGELYVTGRIKDLVIIRGRNLYPQDLEHTAEGAHPALRSGCGAAFAIDSEGEERLVIVHEIARRLEADATEAAAAIRQAVAEEHEVRVHDVVILRAGHLPKTTSGKIQRHACRAAYPAGDWKVLVRATSGGDRILAEAPRSGFDRAAFEATEGAAREALLADFLSREAAHALRLDEAIDRRSPLTRLGLDSLTAVELKQGLEAELSAEVSIASLLGGCTVEELAAELATALTHHRPRTAPAPTPAAGAADGEHPLSHGQRALWFLARLAPDSTAYNVTAAARLLWRLDAAALKHALTDLVERHPVLRSTFHQVDGRPIQRIHPEPRFGFRVHDASLLSAAARTAALDAEADRVFDLENGPLFRVTVWSTSHDEHLLLVAMHHIISDFWSMAILARELGALYRFHSQTESEAADRAPADLPRLLLTYGDYAVWQRERLAGEAGRRQWDFWRQRLHGPLPELELPVDRPRPAVRSDRGSEHKDLLSTELTSAVRRLATDHDTTLFMTLLAAYQTLLQRLCNQDDLVVGTPTAGRGAASLAGLVGYFVNPVALRADLAGDPSVTELLGRTRSGVIEAFEHQDFPLALLAERLQPDRDLSRSPLFNTLFVLQGSQHPEERHLAAWAVGLDGVDAAIEGLELQSVAIEQRVAQF
ncbi:MAG: condensation domain-containing protein, partial [Acidobacteriota bacterium]